jgi:hypothetical protein
LIDDAEVGGVLCLMARQMLFASKFFNLEA